ncbi:type ISP restriction/modification enzyme [Helicobacter typhlonius]|uniref:type ISP restriction/modification enzyme n=1 Tax=Helicobacter typhlonius TaxID=76936 RepID=UPI002FE0913A
MDTQHFHSYAASLQSILATNSHNEHSFRTPLEILLNALKNDEKMMIIHEPKAEIGQGNIRPDYKVYKRIDSKSELSYNALMGFIECKKWGEDLQSHISGKQIDKYLSICPNILLTNYNHFILISFGKKIAEATLFPYGLESNLFNKEKDIAQITTFYNLLNDFFNASQVNIKSKAEVIKILSTQSFYLSLKIRESYQTQEKRTSFHKFFEKTYETFRNITRYTFELEDFCDILAQSVVYGLLVAHLESQSINGKEYKNIEITQLESFVNLLPKEFSLLSEFIYFSIPSFYIPDSVAYALENIKKAIALIDKPTLAKALNTQIESISIYLYEDFLKAYDELRGTEKRKEGGVFYTPDEVVSCITYSLNEILKKDFGKEKGFADKEVKVLDFATGTGSFLAKVFEIILNEEQSKVFQIASIKDKFLKDIYGFELSFVPYIVAHIKLSSILKNAGFKDFDNEHKLQIFLTNTLDLSPNADYTMSMPLVLLEEQDIEARRIKHREEVLVILGNPPYNNKSKNNLPEITRLLTKYKEGLNETKINLDDDYIKFIRFAQWKLLERTDPDPKEALLFAESAYNGLMGFITNNSFIWGRTHRKMRQSLFESFDRIYIINLHGDSEKDSKGDENVFDIRVGVCISLFVKYPQEHKDAASKLFYYSTADNGIFKRVDKYNLLNEVASQGLDSIHWQELEPKEPYFWFIKRDLENDEYENFWALTEDKALGDSKSLFQLAGSGIKTDRDELSIHFNEQNLLQVLKDFKELDSETIKEKYEVEDSNAWQLQKAKDDINTNQGKNVLIAYRPFDKRLTYYTGKQGFLSRPRFQTVQHFLQGENIGICFTKDYSGYYDAPLISDLPIDIHYNGGQAYIAPLYRYESTTNDDKQTHKIEKVPNFTESFKQYCQSHTILKDKSPESILCFIYANLYNPNYRQKYAEYLKIGFPRINFDISQKTFDKLESLGERLMRLHLMRQIPQDSSIMLNFRNDKHNTNFTIKKLSGKERYINSLLILNDDLHIKGITQEVYDYTIGGYKVIEKWLNYRANYECSKDEIQHLVDVCKILKATIELEKDIALC